jgi:O-antigen/teichoic acid export membrane protein
MSDQNNSNNKRIAKNTLFLYVRTIVIMLVSLYTSRVVLDVLGETDYGIYNVVGGIVVMFSFINYALATATQRFLSFSIGKKDYDEVSRIFSMSLTTYVFTIFVIALLAETLGLWFFYEKMNIPAERITAAAWVYHTSILVFCVKILRVPYHSSIISYERMSFYAYVSIVEAILNLIIVYALIYFNSDYLIEYSILLLVVAILVNICYITYCKRYFTTCNYRFFWDKELFVKLFSFSGWSMLGGVANVASNQGLSIILNIFTNVVVNAAMGIASTVSSAVNTFVSNFQTAFVPQLVKTYSADDHQSFIRLISNSSRFSYYLIFILGVPFIFFCKEILAVWLVEVPGFTLEFTQLLLVYCMIDALSGPLWYSVQATGKIKNYQIVMALLIIINLPIAYFLLKLGYSPVWAVAVRVIINVIAHLARIIYLRFLIDFPYKTYLREVMLNAFLITMIGCPISYYIHTLYKGSFISLVITFILAIILNIIIVVLCGLRQNEKKQIVSYIRNKFIRYEKCV